MKTNRVTRRQMIYKKRSTQSRCLKSVLKETGKIQRAMDGQTEEEIGSIEELNKELHKSNKALISLERYNSNLKRKCVEMRITVEDGRRTVWGSIHNLTELESEASMLLKLQKHI